MSGRWNGQQSARFVDLYREEENLWDMFNPDYKNRDIRMASLQRIVQEMALPNFAIKDVPKKIKNLRSTYRQEALKVKKSKSSGAGSDDVYQPKIKWFDTMDYIMKNSNLKDKETESNMGQDNEPEVHISNEKSFQNDGSEIDAHDDAIASTRTVEKTMPRSRINKICLAVRELKSLNKSLSDRGETSHKVEDECDIVGKHIAIQLRQLPLAQMIQANVEIQQLLMKYRLKTVDLQREQTPLSFDMPTTSNENTSSSLFTQPFSPQDNGFSPSTSSLGYFSHTGDLISQALHDVNVDNN